MILLHLNSLKSCSPLSDIHKVRYLIHFPVSFTVGCNFFVFHKVELKADSVYPKLNIKNNFDLSRRDKIELSQTLFHMIHEVDSSVCFV